MKRKMLLNSSSGLFMQFAAIIVGLILPRFMISTFGSNVNGLVNSITQFLSYITLFDAGIGGVVRAALYDPLSRNDKNKINGILKASKNYFDKIALFFIVYVLALSILFPFAINQTFNVRFTAPLVLIIAISIFAEYYIGITYGFLLQADARNYVINFIQGFSTIINAALVIVLIRSGSTIHVVKLVSSIVFAAKPFLLMVYVSKKYEGLSLKSVSPDFDALTQRNNAFAHHVAWFLHTNTDIVVVTIFGSLASVSVYSVYYMVANSLTKVSIAISSGVEGFFGKRMVTSDESVVRSDFKVLRMIMDSIVIVLFMTAGCLLMPFIVLYTKGITDANYIEPVFGYFLLFAEGVYCLRLPYHNVITAAGHFKETQKSAIIETCLNVVLSITLIRFFSLTGVAIATLVAMLYRTIYDIYYMSHNLLKVSFWSDLVRVFATVAICSLGVLFKNIFVNVPTNTIGTWVVQGIVCFVISVVIALAYDLLFYRDELKKIKEIL